MFTNCFFYIYLSQGDGHSFPLRWQMSSRSPSVINGNGHCVMEGTVGKKSESYLKIEQIDSSIQVQLPGLERVI